MNILIALIMLLCGVNGEAQGPKPTVVVYYQSGLVFEYMTSPNVQGRDLNFVMEKPNEAMLSIDNIELKIKDGDLACMRLERLPVQYHGKAKPSVDPKYPGLGCISLKDAEQPIK